MRTRNYLETLALPDPEVSLPFLKKLQDAHVGLLPFSSLGVLLHEDLSLDSDALFDRVVAGRRGGYCFEQNKICFEVLNSLGYRCDIVLARVLHNRDVDVPRTHRITRVALAGDAYIVDVGFGPLGPREPLRLDVAEPQDQGDAVYRIRQPHPGQYLLQIQEAQGWYTLYSFDNGHYTEADCLCGHHYSSTHPKAKFVNNLVVSRNSFHDLRVLKNGEFHRRQGEKTSVAEISSQEQLGAVLWQEFGICLDSRRLSGLYEGYCRPRRLNLP